MDGITLVRSRLLSRQELVARMGAGAASRVRAGVVPEGSLLPALGVTEVSRNDRRRLASGAVVKVTARVQITILAKDTPAIKALLLDVRRACREFVGVVSGVPVTMQLEEAGPDFEHQSGFQIQTQDVMVTYDEPA